MEIVNLNGGSLRPQLEKTLELFRKADIERDKQQAEHKNQLEKEASNRETTYKQNILDTIKMFS